MDYYNLDVAHYDDEIQLTIYTDEISYNYKMEEFFGDVEIGKSLWERIREVKLELAQKSQSDSVDNKQKLKLDAKAVANKKLNDRVSRCIRSIHEYSRANKWDYFATFTIADEEIRNDYKKAKQRITRFLNNFKLRKCPELQYLCVPEMHKKGGWHFHALIQGDLSDWLVKSSYHDDYELVPYQHIGFNNIQAVKDTHRISKYITKYITKDLCSVTFGSQRYFVSKGLNKGVHEKKSITIEGWTDMSWEDVLSGAVVEDAFRVEAEATEFEHPEEVVRYKTLFDMLAKEYPDYELTHTKRLDIKSDYKDKAIVYLQLRKVVVENE